MSAYPYFAEVQELPWSSAVLGSAASGSFHTCLWHWFQHRGTATRQCLFTGLDYWTGLLDSPKTV